MDKRYVVTVTRAGSTVRCAWVWIPTLPLTDEVWNSSYSMSLSLLTSRRGFSIAPETASPFLARLSRPCRIWLMQLFLSLFSSLTGLVSDLCSMLFPTKRTLHVLCDIGQGISLSWASVFLAMERDNKCRGQFGILETTDTMQSLVAIISAQWRVILAP